YLEAPLLGKGNMVGRDPYSQAMSAGLAWLESEDNAVNILRDPRKPNEGILLRGYNLYGLERVGLASGFKHLGSHDWYLELAGKMLEQQQPDGAWRGDFGLEQNDPVVQRNAIIETAYTLLFLARGRHPVMMN